MNTLQVPEADSMDAGLLSQTKERIPMQYNEGRDINELNNIEGVSVGMKKAPHDELCAGIPRQYSTLQVLAERRARG